MRPRIIPTLLLRDTYLVKGINFLKHKYVGDPINAVRIFSKMEVDELFFLDIDATNKGCITSLEFIKTDCSLTIPPILIFFLSNSIKDFISDGDWKYTTFSFNDCKISFYKF